MKILNTLFAFTLAIFLLGASELLAWTEPGSAPPAGNVVAPLRLPLSSLTLSGSSPLNIVFDTTSGSDYNLSYNSSAGGFGIWDNTAGEWRLLTQNTTGNVGIGLTNPNYKLSVGGSVQASESEEGTPGTPGSESCDYVEVYYDDLVPPQYVFEYQCTAIPGSPGQPGSSYFATLASNDANAGVVGSAVDNSASKVGIGVQGFGDIGVAGNSSQGGVAGQIGVRGTVANGTADSIAVLGINSVSDVYLRRGVRGLVGTLPSFYSTVITSGSYLSGMSSGAIGVEGIVKNPSVGDQRSVGVLGVHDRNGENRGFGVYCASNRTDSSGCGGNKTWTSQSDARLKKNVNTISNALNKVLNLRGVTYQWKSDTENNLNIGFIAQEVEKVLPEVITKDLDGYYSISESSINAVIVEAMKELKAENDSLRARIEALEAKIK